MKFYYGSKIDAQGRIVLGEKPFASGKVVFYIKDECEDVVYIEPYEDDDEIPSSFARAIDAKNRVVLPAWLRKNYNRTLIGYDHGVIVVKLIKE